MHFCRGKRSDPTMKASARDTALEVATKIAITISLGHHRHSLQKAAALVWWNS